MPGCNSKEHADKIAAGVKKYWEKHPELRKKYSIECSDRLKKNPIRNFNKDHTYEHTLKMRESAVGGFWYGSVQNDPRKYENYCELWNEDLRERIRAYWGYVSALSIKPETSINRFGTIRSLVCHHIYYQPKACCVWDEDEKGYYTNINAGTIRNPYIVKYYIDGDPNKFVTLTAKEHAYTNFNRFDWIILFEKLIEDQGGKCYFTKEEMENLLK